MGEAKDYLLKVGKNIKKHRLAAKIKQVDLAYACNFDKQTLYKIETGKVNLTLKTLLKLSTSLNVSVKDLVDVQ
ncbi:MAG: family transcriptional regulator [Bacteroidetes bacterium]|jgi:DNA-binding XRE family transcriptional regulator|nr:family transcriptional regulator [Bacteroidota bacterium]